MQFRNATSVMRKHFKSGYFDWRLYRYVKRLVRGRAYEGKCKTPKVFLLQRLFVGVMSDLKPKKSTPSSVCKRTFSSRGCVAVRCPAESSVRSCLLLRSQHPGAGACEGSAQAPGPARLCPGCRPARPLARSPLRGPGDCFVKQRPWSRVIWHSLLPGRRLLNGVGALNQTGPIERPFLPRPRSVEKRAGAPAELPRAFKPSPTAAIGLPCESHSGPCRLELTTAHLGRPVVPVSGPFQPHVAIP